MNNSVYELLLKNNENTISYLIDFFQENTINSQKVIIDIIDIYRNRFEEINNNKYSLVFRRITESFDKWKTENVIKIKDTSIFYVDAEKNINFEKTEIISRWIKILETTNFKL